MSRSADERIADIRAAIARCRRYVDDLNSPEGHTADMAFDALERNIAVIGEAASHLPDDVTSQISGVDWPAIRGMRNILIHEYFRVDPAILRDVVQTRLQPLDEALNRSSI